MYFVSLCQNMRSFSDCPPSGKILLRVDGPGWIFTKRIELRSDT